MFKRTALAAAVLFGASAAAQADPILIDSFDLEQDVGLLGIPMFIPSSSQVGPAASVLGGFRDLEASGTATNFLETRLQVSGGELNFSNNVGTTGGGEITWDGDDDPESIDSTGLGGLDITMNGGWSLDRFVFGIESADLPGLQIEIAVVDTSDNVSLLSTTLVAPVFAPQSLEFLFSDFTPVVGSGADFTDVGAIQMSLGGPPEIDASFSNFQIGADHSNDLPLPATLSLLLAGLASYGWMSRKKR